MCAWYDNEKLFFRLESEQRHLEEQAMRQNAAKMSSIDKNNQVSCGNFNFDLENYSESSILQEDRIIAEAKNDKIRYLEEVHSAQRKVTDLQTHLKVLESKLAEKDTEIRLLQEKKSKFLSNFTYWQFNDFAVSALQFVVHHLIRIIVLA